MTDKYVPNDKRFETVLDESYGLLNSYVFLRPENPDEELIKRELLIQRLQYMLYAEVPQFGDVMMHFMTFLDRCLVQIELDTQMRSDIRNANQSLWKSYLEAINKGTLPPYRDKPYSQLLSELIAQIHASSESGTYPIEVGFMEVVREILTSPVPTNARQCVKDYYILYQELTDIRELSKGHRNEVRKKMQDLSDAYYTCVGGNNGQR